MFRIEHFRQTECDNFANIMLVLICSESVLLPAILRSDLMVTSPEEKVVFIPNFITRFQDGKVPDCANLIRVEEDDEARVSVLGLIDKINGHTPTSNYCVDTVGVGDQLLVLKVFHYLVDFYILYSIIFSAILFWKEKLKMMLIMGTSTPCSLYLGA